MGYLATHWLSGFRVAPLNCQWKVPSASPFCRWRNRHREVEGAPEFPKPLREPPGCVQAAIQTPSSLLPSGFVCVWRGGGGVKGWGGESTRGPRGQNRPPSTGGTPTSKKTALECEGLALGQLQTGGTFWKAKGFGGGSLQRRAGVCYPTPTSHPQPRQMEGCSARGLWEHPTRAKSRTLTLELKQGRSRGPPQRVGAGGWVTH